jgi:hypothetical protein
MQGACFELTTLPRTISGTAWTGRPLFAAFKQMQFISARNESSKQASTEAAYGRKAMNWFSRTTSIAGMQVSNWILVIVAVVVLWIIYSAFIH